MFTGAGLRAFLPQAAGFETPGLTKDRGPEARGALLSLFAHKNFMNKFIYPLTILFVCLVSALQAQTLTPTIGDIVLSADRGELVVLAPPSQDGISRIQWLLNEPSDFEHLQVDAKSFTLYLAMPARDVNLSLVMAPDDVNLPLQIMRYRIHYVDKDKDGDDPEPDPDDDDQDDDPPGPAPDDIADDYGVGKFAFDKSRGKPKAERDHAAKLLEQAAKHLQGIDGLKFIDSDDAGDDNVFTFLAVGAADWFTPINDRLKSLKSQRLTLKQWQEAFREAAEAVKR